MAKLDTIQTSFASGEWSSPLWGRSDLAQYASACAIVENWIIRPYGSIITAGGTEYINACKTGGTTSVVRVMPFVFSRTDAYVIEMGVGYFRFYNDGAVVTSNGSLPYEVAHTYAASEINDIDFKQKNDVIWLTHDDNPVRRLIRTASNNWTLEDYDIIGGPFLTENTTLTIKLNPSGTNGTINITVSPTNSSLFTVSGATLGHKNTYWRIGAASTTTDSTTGLDVQGYVQLTNIVNSYTATATVIKILGSTTATSEWSEGAFSSVRGYPALVTFHKQRLTLARTDYEPNGLWMSKPFVYDDFGVNGGQDGDAIDIELASGEADDLKFLASGKSLHAGSYGGDFSISSGDGSPLTPSNTNSAKETGWGAEGIIPQKIGSFFYYVQRFGKKLREMSYDWVNDAFKSKDATILAPHVAGTSSTGGFTELAYQQNPDSVLWCLSTNGTIATMTREVDQELIAWSRQTTDGTYESICAIPSYDENYDEIWVVVSRTINSSTVRYIERFKNHIPPSRQDLCWNLHSALRYNAYTAYTTTTISLSATSGTSVLVTSSTASFTSSDVGQRIRSIDANGATNGELKITGYTSTTIVLGNITYAFSSSTVAANSWGLSVDEISSLGHLEAKTVSVLADGGVDKPTKTVSNASITLAYNYFVVLVGLAYTPTLETLPQEKAAQRGTAQGKLQRINEITFKVNRSFTGFYVGWKAGEMDKFRLRDQTTLMGTPPSLTTGTLTPDVFRGGYERGAKVRIEVRDPLPVELLSIITAIDTQEN